MPRLIVRVARFKIAKISECAPYIGVYQDFTPFLSTQLCTLEQRFLIHVSMSLENSGSGVAKFTASLTRKKIECMVDIGW